MLTNLTLYSVFSAIMVSDPTFCSVFSALVLKNPMFYSVCSAMMLKKPMLQHKAVHGFCFCFCIENITKPAEDFEIRAFKLQDVGFLSIIALKVL